MVSLMIKNLIIIVIKLTLKANEAMLTLCNAHVAAVLRRRLRHAPELMTVKQQQQQQQEQHQQLKEQLQQEQKSSEAVANEQRTKLQVTLSCEINNTELIATESQQQQQAKSRSIEKVVKMRKKR